MRAGKGRWKIWAAMLYVFKIRYLTALVLAMFFLGLDAVVEYLSVVLAEIIFPLLHGNIRNVLALPEDTLIVLGGRLLLFISTFITLISFAGIAANGRFHDVSLFYLAMAVLVIDYVVYYLIDEII